MDEKSRKIGELYGAGKQVDGGEQCEPPKEAPLASEPTTAEKPKAKARQLTCWKCQQEHKPALFTSTEDHFRFKDGRKLCPAHKVTYMAWLAEQKKLATERERILLADLNRPVIKTKSTQPTPVLLSGDLSGPSFGRR